MFRKTNFLSVKNYYKILGITIKSTDIDIKKAFFSLAKIHHPDVNKNPGAKEKFAEILEAYDVLSDENKREVYDKSGLTAAQQEDLEYESKISEINKGFYSDKIDYSSDEDLLNYDKDLEIMIKKSNDLFGEKQNDLKNHYTNSDNTSHILNELDISFMDSILGCNKYAHFKKYILCSDCKGEFCQKCSYSGFRLQETSESITIPTGIELKEDTNIYIKLKGKGNEYKIDNILKTSDVYIKINISDHEYFKREGMNIITDNYVTISQYVLGGKITVGTLYGNKEVNIPPYKDKVTIRNYGVNKKGDHIINIKIRLPSKLNSEQERLFKEIRKYEV